MRMRSFSAVVAVGFLLVFAAPAADAGGFYVGGSVGQTSADTGFVDSGFTPGLSVDDTNTGFKVFGGYSILRFLAVEAAWVDVSEVSVEMSTPTPVTMTSGADGFSVEAMGILPLGKGFQLFAEYGMYMWDGTVALVSSDPLIPSGSASDDGTDPTYGLGVGWNFKGPGSLRFEMERYAMEEMDVDMYSLGFSFSF